MAALDRIDRDILARLQKDARLSNKELAAAVGLAPSSCLARVRQLTAAGVLQTAHYRVLPAALGVGLEAMVFVRLGDHRRTAHEAFHAHVAAQPEVVASYSIGGADDFLVRVAVRDTPHLRDFVLDALSERPEVSGLRTEVIFDALQSEVLPDYLG